MPQRRRNPLGALPILGKGGVHVRSKSGQRSGEKRQLASAIDEYFDDQNDTTSNDELERLDSKPVEPSTFVVRPVMAAIAPTL